MNMARGIPLGRWWGIEVVMSPWFIILVVLEIARADKQSQPLVMLGAGLLVVIVLLHEFGHALACKAVGGEVERIVLWPLGGFTQMKPPQKAWAHLVSVAGGPLVNALLIVACCGIALAALPWQVGDTMAMYRWAA